MAALAAAAILALAVAPAEARSRGRSRAAQRLRVAAPEDPDSPSSGWAAPTGTFDAALGWTRAGAGTARDGLGPSAALALRQPMPRGFAVNLSAFLQPVPDAAGGGLVLPSAAWIETLNLRWATESTVVFAGKFHPRSGEAWFRLPGLYAADFAGDYELREKVGAGAQLDLAEVLGLPDRFGEHDLRIEAFRADVGALSGSALSGRWPVQASLPDDGAGAAPARRARRNARAFGGADNTPRGGAVLSLSADGLDLPGGAGLGWTLAGSWREPGADAAASGRAAVEHGAVAAVFAEIGLPLGVRLMPLAEVAHRGNPGGFGGAEARWATGGLTLERGAISLTGVAMWRSASGAGAGPAVQARQRAANLTLGIGQLAGLAALAPLSLSLDWRRFVQGGAAGDDVSVALLLGFQF